MKIIISALLVFLTGVQAFTQLTGWQYITPVTIYENSGANLTDYQVLLTFDTQTPITAGKMKTDGSDIRFAEDVDGVLLMDYWIESGINTISTNIWVKVPFIPASDSVIIYLFYGNPAAVAVSSVANTFIREINGVQLALPMDENTGITTSDQSGNSNTGNLNGPVWTTGKFGNALGFDGTNDYVTTPFNPVENQPFTLNVWTYPLTSSGEKMIAGSCVTAWDGFWFEIIGDDIRSYHQNGACQMQGTENLPVSTWHFLTLVYDGASYRHYADATQTNSQTCSFSIDYANTLYVGSIGSYSITNYLFNGTLDELRFYNQALSLAELTDLYNNYGYVTPNYPGKELVRKYSSPGPTVSIGVENFISSIAVTNDTSICTGNSVALTVTITDSTGFPAPYTFLWSPADSLSCTACQSPVANPSSTTTYMVMVTDSAGSQDSAFVTVTIFSLPPVADAGLDTAICEGDSVQLNATGGAYYSWSPASGLSNTGIANPYANPIITTAYEVSVSNGCGSDVDSVIVTVNPLPVLLSTDTTVCPGDTVQLNAGGGVSYLWSPGSGLSDSTVANPVASPSVSTNYILNATSVSGCTLVDSVRILIVTVPPISATASQDTICPGSSTQLSVNVTDTTFNYTWTPSTGLSNPNIANPIASPLSTTTYIVSVIIGSCSGSDTITIYVDTSNFITATQVTAICEGDSVQLSVTGSAGLPDDSLWTYVWSPGNTLTDSTAAAPLAFPASATTYQITVSNLCGVYTDTVTVTVNPAPTVDAGADTSYCFGESGVGLEALGAPSFVWSPAAGLTCTACTKPTASPSSTTTYYVTGTSVNGCTNTDSIRIIVNGIPVAATSSTDSICQGEFVQLFTQSVCNQQIIYSENFTNGISYCPGDPQYDNWVTFRNQLDTTTNSFTKVTIKGSLDTTGRSCTDMATVQQMAAALFNGTAGTWTCGAFTWHVGTGCWSGGCGTNANAIEFNATGSDCACDAPGYILRPGIANSNWGGVNSPTCGGTTQTMTVVFETGSACPSDSSLTYSWSPGSTLSDSTIYNPLASPLTTTTYVVTVGDSSCSKTDSITVTVDNTILVLTPSSDVGICTGDSVQLYATSNNPIVSWSWSPADGLSDTAIANPVANPSVTTTYTVTATNVLGCQLTKDVTVSVAPYPVASFTHSDSALTVAFTDASVNAGTWVWEFGDGITSGLLNPTYTYADTGTYNVCLTVTNACTSDTLCENITVTDCQFPLALFGYSVSGFTADFTDLSLNVTGWSWNFGDTSTINTNQNPTHTYADTGTYNVCLTVTNACGTNNKCNAVSITSATGITENYLENAVKVYPNPSADGVFMLEIYDLRFLNYDLKIYDVFGREILKSKIKNQKSKIDLSGHPAGIYNLQIITDQGAGNKKIIIE